MQDVGIARPEVPPAPNRDNIVVSHNSKYVAPGATVVENLTTPSIWHARRFPTTGSTVAKSG